MTGGPRLGGLDAPGRQAIIEYATPLHSRDDAHGLPHVLRVLENARAIHAGEGGDWPTVEAIVYLHDVGRAREQELLKAPEQAGFEKPVHHALLGARMAGEFLRAREFPASVVEAILHGIRAHSFSAGVAPETLESEIVSDADKLDAMGAIGLYRTIHYQVVAGTGLAGVVAHLHDKLLSLHETLLTPTGRRLGASRARFLHSWLDQLRREAPRRFPVERARSI